MEKTNKFKEIVSSATKIHEIYIKYDAEVNLQNPKRKIFTEMRCILADNGKEYVLRWDPKKLSMKSK